jgi:SAM-dependent methyltransferase
LSKPLANLYRNHHRVGTRLQRSVAEKRRGDIFRTWIGTGKTVVDLGCRDGTLTRHFYAGNRVTGCDIDADALEHASGMYGFETRQVDLNGTLPFANDVFDIAVMGEVLEHLPYWDITLSEVRRILRPGGMLIGSIPLAYHVKDRWRVLWGKKLLSAKDPTHLQFPSYDDFIARMQQFFEKPDVIVVRGRRWWCTRYPRLFATMIAFRCVKPKSAPDAARTA